VIGRALAGVMLQRIERLSQTRGKRAESSFHFPFGGFRIGLQVCVRVAAAIAG
jgi:hypothetical protein